MTVSNSHAEQASADVTATTAPERQRVRRRRDDGPARSSLSADALLADASEFAKEIREILTRLHDIAWLASHPLAVPAAQARQNQTIRRSGRSHRSPAEASFTPEYLGESLSERVRSAIRTLEPSAVRRRASAASRASGEGQPQHGASVTNGQTGTTVGIDSTNDHDPANPVGATNGTSSRNGHASTNGLATNGYTAPDAQSMPEATDGHATNTKPLSGGATSVRQHVERAVRRAKVMRLRFIENQEIPAIIEALNIGRSEYFRLQADGSLMVAELLRRAWDTSVRAPGDHAPADIRPEAILTASTDLRTGEVTRFIGREKEIADVASLASMSRLITILGAPGAGKTRLALEVARTIGTAFGGGTVVISLADLDHESRVLPAIGRAFDIYDVSPLELEYQLVSALQDRRTLLVLDNFEHVLHAGAQVARLVAGVPSLSVIATSRAPLGVVGEQRFTLDPLPLPAANVCDGDLSPLQANPAVDLFIDRARAIDPAFPRTQIDLDATVDICRLLDGLPLSIELAAARLATLTASAILDRLHQTGSLHTVATGPRNAPPRHQTLHGAISWSRGLLSNDEARTLGILSSFVGGASLPAILSVALGADDVDPCTPDALAVFNRIESLVLHNLVRRHAMADGSTRYGMLEAVRAYGLELLVKDGSSDTVRARHAAYFARLAKHHGSKKQGGVSNQLIHEIDLDLPNTRAALTYYLESGQPLTALDVIANLEFFWWLQGYRLEGFTWLGRTLTAAGDSLPSHLRARTLVVAGHLRALNGEDVRAYPHLIQGLAVAQECGERRAERDALHHLGVLARARGSDQEASQRWQACLRIAAETGDFYREGVSLWHLGMLAYDRHDTDGANEWLDAARAIFERHDDPIGLGLVQPSEGQVAMATGDRIDARRLIEGAIRNLELHGSATGMMYAVGILAELEYLDGNLDAAFDAAERSIALMNGLGQPRGVARNLITLGHVTTALGDFGRARHVYLDALRRSIAQGRVPNIAAALIGMAGLVIADHGDRPVQRDTVQAEASRLLTAGYALLASIARQTNPVDQRHAAQWLADIAPATATATVAHALRTARALAATASFDVTPLPASG
jgi:predicted ATPase